MNADYINPFLTSTVTVFRTMLNTELTRETPFVRHEFAPQFEVTAMIGLSGTSAGTVAVSMPREMALWVTEKLLGEAPESLNAQVVDAVGELTNMIAGAAKAQLAHLQMSLGLPTVMTGKSNCIAFPSNVTPISIPFRSSFGRLIVEVGILP